MNRWYFWVLAPIMVTTAVGLPLWTDPPTWYGRIVMYVICMTLVFATLGLSNPKRFSWAFKPVAATVFLGYSVYVVTEFVGWLRGDTFGLGKPQSDANLFNALCGFIVIAIPSLMYTFWGRTGKAVDVLLHEEPVMIKPFAEGNDYPPAVDAQMVGKYPALAKSGGGYFYDEVLEYRVWIHPEGGGEDFHDGEDYYYSFATFDEAFQIAITTPDAEDPIVLVRQYEQQK